MNNFKWVNAKDVNEAASALKNNGAAMGGGIELLCLLKDDLIRPERVVNLKAIKGMKDIKGNNGLTIGAAVTIDAIANNATVKSLYTVLADAARSVASPQIRNVGTLGGNLCQRPRCWYFRDSEVNCLKKGGGLCYAVNGSNEYHAILGGGPCFIVHPSDLAPALIALDATVTTNKRKMKVEEVFVLPSENVKAETKLAADEIVTEVALVPGGWKSAYYKAKERPSFDWALSSCAVALKLSGTTISDARVVLGGVAPIPWRSKEAEAALKGKSASAETFAAAGRAAVADANPLSDNAYKVPLTANVIKIACLRAAGMKEE